MVQKVDFPNIVVELENRFYYLNFEAEKTAVSRKSVRIHRVFCLCSWKTRVYRWFRAFFSVCSKIWLLETL